ncbi:MAG: hypothetical protein ACI4VQ_04740 [Clostridia bacterium]
MSNNDKKSTNGGLKFKVLGGDMTIDEKENELKMPPEGAVKIALPQKEEDYMTIPLVPDVEMEKASEGEPDKE